MAEKNGNGLVVFHVNVNLDCLEKIRPQELIDLVRENHIEDISKLKENGWHCIFMPCIGEASRVEKIDLKKPTQIELDITNHVSIVDNTKFYRLLIIYF